MECRVSCGIWEYAYWNPTDGLVNGMTFFFLFFLVDSFCFLHPGSAYVCLVYCIMETTSALPIAGAFGLTRTIIGPYAGFMIAGIEALQYITYTAATVITFSSMILSLMDADVIYTPAVCFLFYVSALIFHIPGGWVFWQFNSLLAIVSLLIVVIYCLGSLEWTHFDENAGVVDTTNSTKVYFVGGGRGFMKMVIYF